LRLAHLPGFNHARAVPNYRRAYIPGGTYFFTVTLLDRRQRLLVEHIDALRVAFRAIRATVHDGRRRRASRSLALPLDVAA